MSTQKFSTNALHAGHDVTKNAGTRAVQFIKHHRMFLTIQITQPIFLDLPKLDLSTLD